MTIRQSLAAVIAFLFLSVSSWAAACDISCSFQQTHSACQTTGNAQKSEASDSMPADMDMMDMAGQHATLPDTKNTTTVPKSPSHNMSMDHGRCEHIGRPESRPAVAFLQARSYGSCTYDPCYQSATSASADSGLNRIAITGIAFATANTAALPVPDLLTHWAESERPPKISPVDPLSFSLRI